MARQNAEKRRRCFECPASITACMGFVFAGDWLGWITGKRKSFPREICGHCAMKYYDD